MKTEEALVTALEYEHRVRDHFRTCAERAASTEARGFFELMAGEEQGHVDYLEAKLARWRKSGSVGQTELATAVPARDWLARGQQTLGPPRPPAGGPSPGEHLFRALELEHEVSAFYRKLVDAVEDPEAAGLFQRFLEIEDGHTALVQAEIDHETRTGVFFGVQEFTLDGG